MNTSHQLGSNGKVSLTVKKRIVKGTFSDDHSVFSFDDDDERANFVIKNEPNFEFNPFSVSKNVVYDNDNADEKKEQSSAEFLNLDE